MMKRLLHQTSRLLLLCCFVRCGSLSPVWRHERVGLARDEESWQVGPGLSHQGGVPVVPGQEGARQHGELDAVACTTSTSKQGDTMNARSRSRH